MFECYQKQFRELLYFLTLTHSNSVLFFTSSFSKSICILHEIIKLKSYFNPFSKRISNIKFHLTCNSNEVLYQSIKILKAKGEPRLYINGSQIISGRLSKKIFRLNIDSGDLKNKYRKKKTNNSPNQKAHYVHINFFLKNQVFGSKFAVKTTRLAILFSNRHEFSFPLLAKNIFCKAYIFIKYFFDMFRKKKNFKLRSVDSKMENFYDVFINQIGKILNGKILIVLDSQLIDYQLYRFPFKLGNVLENLDSLKNFNSGISKLVFVNQKTFKTKNINSHLDLRTALVILISLKYSKKKTIYFCNK